SFVIRATRDARFVFSLTDRTEHFWDLDSPVCALFFVFCFLYLVPGLTKYKELSTKNKAHLTSNGISSKCVIRLNARKRSLISACVRRLTRSVPNSSTLNEAITDPKIIARLIALSSSFS